MGEQHTGGMIALVPSQVDLARLAVPGGDDPSELHLTLAYLGDDVSDLDDSGRATLQRVVRDLGARFAPVRGQAMAHAVFNPNGGEHDPATVYLVSGAGLTELRDEVDDHSVSTHPTFLPHVTAGYDLPVGRLTYTGPVTFDRVRLALGPTVLDVPLTGAPVEDTPGPDPDDTETKDGADGDDPDDRPGRSGPKVAGLALIAADTGRVLMLQRALADPDADEPDPAAGTWEFPGGHLESDDETDLHGAMREWAEEVGRPAPTGAVHAAQWDSPDGVYRGHVLTIDREADLDLSAERSVYNPDDDSEQVAWWEIDHAEQNPALRKECRRTPWRVLRGALDDVRAAGDAAQEKAGGGGHKPPQGVQTAAKRAQQLISAGKAGAGFTDVGRKRAADLARGAAVSDETVRRMKAYFDRHQPDRGAHWGKAGAETPGYVAWLAWGGDAGRAWAGKVVRALDSESKGAEQVHTEFKADGPPQPRKPVEGSGAAASTQSDGKKKRKVASKAGEARYGLPIGTELGNARDERSKAAQSDKGAQGLYEQLRKTDPSKYREMLDKLSDGDLEKLTRLLYSARSSNPAIVAARLAAAGALRRKGKDVNDYGGLGKAVGKGRPAAKRKAGGLQAGKDYMDLDNLSDAQVDALKAQGWRGRAGDGKERLYRPGAKGADMSEAEVKEISQARREAAPTLPGSGSPGKFPIDSEETLLSAIRLHNSSDAPAEDVKRHILTQARKLDLMDKVPEDWKGSGDSEEKSLPAFASTYADAWLADAEAKTRTTTKPWETRKAQRAGDTIGKEKSNDKDGGDEYPIRTIGDVASAIKKAKAIKDPDRKKEVQAHIRKGANKINAGNMIPKEWGSGGDSGSGKAAPKKKGNPFAKKSDPGTGLEYSDTFASLADAIQSKVMSPNPNAVRLREYWAHGKGRAKWNPGTPGDFDRLKRAVRKYIPKHMLNGFVANVHKLATGEWPGKRAHGGKALDLGDRETTVIEVDEMKAAMDVVAADDDAVSLSLDAYADMADQLTSEEEYEQAMADEVDWDMLSDGTLAEREQDETDQDWDDGLGENPDGFGAGPEGDDEEDDEEDEGEGSGDGFDPDDLLSELESAR